MVKNFVIIGAAGYIAPRHMKAIRDTGNFLLAAMDVNDSVGILDNYFTGTQFFTNIEALEQYLAQIIREGTKVDYLVVCTPNYLHEEHIRLGLRVGANVICEKPVALYPEDIATLLEEEANAGKKIATILQLRLHPALMALKEKIKNDLYGKIYTVELQYFTSRGNWYAQSWKGDVQKSGGIATNIGIHFFDMLQWVFGAVQKNDVLSLTATSASGELQLEKARVKWQLSIDEKDLPQYIITEGKKAYRMMKVDEELIEFSDGLGDLHTKSYEEILKGNGFALAETLPSIQIVNDIRNKNS